MYNKMTKHATVRTRERSICIEGINAAICYGLCRMQEGSFVYILGMNEINQAFKNGIDIQCYKNIAVIVGHDNNIITVYRNKKRCSLHKEF